MSGNQKVLSFPSAKDAGIFVVGFLIGMFVPGFFTSFLTYIAKNGLITGYLEDKLAGLGNTDVSAGNAVKTFVFLGGLVIILYALAKGAKLLFKFGLGVAVGLGLRVVLMLVGFHIPMATSGGYTVPNSTIS